MVLIYAGVVPSKGKTTTKERERLSLRAKILLHDLREDMIVLPTIAVSEVLVPVPSQQKSVLTAKLQEVFHCCPFDIKASVIASDLWAKYKQNPGDLKYDDRNVLKADAMIIAAAKAAGATDFYSHDKKCRSLASLAGMKDHDLPTHSEDLFLEGEIERGEA